MTHPVTTPKTSEEALEKAEDYNQLLKVVFNPSHYYDLPWELMSMIYRDALVGFHESLTIITTSSGCSTIVEDGNDELKTLLSVSKSFSSKLPSYLDRSLPTHKSLSAKLYLAGEQSITTFHIKNLDKMLPSSAVGLYINIECDVIPGLPEPQLASAGNTTAIKRTFDMRAATCTESTFAAADASHGAEHAFHEQDSHSRPSEAEAHTTISSGHEGASPLKTTNQMANSL
ncbi:hypothetical protein Slin15195_G081930 [Septoria linicola]|uniref:Uncharacterized protein n=1 Tax=Septoria linicola TaxID=215465 RepID=A0A9Q9AT05_9PEZI|nr:hypothetical protein Slin15195_G081930 [Septoria linicola]